MYCSFARVAGRYQYVKPTIHEGDEISIQEGRHPVIERFLEEDGFVPNDIALDNERCQMMILTGPNMAGKSTIMRQVALICLLGQMGSFVPAKKAKLCLLDRVFTRVGASDDLVRGQSTFMVEMSETSNILRNATAKSLVILDEIGRGTSTFDGLAIAWAVAEDLHDRVSAKTIFATHYHELTDLAKTKSRVLNMNVAVKEWKDEIVFLRTLSEGAVNRSYGIEVARLAGVPSSVISRAREILSNLENAELDAYGKPKVAAHKGIDSVEKGQYELFRRISDELLEELQKVQPDELTPKMAMDLIYAWHRKYRTG